MALKFIVTRHYTVVLDVFDGCQYGIMPLAIEAYGKEEAEREAIKQATDDGWQRVKVQFTMGG